MSAQETEHLHAARADAESLAALFPALMVEAERVAHTVAAGLHGRRRAGPGETFWQHRPYGFGDPVGAIDWRQSARSAERLYVRQNEWEAAASVWIWRDPSVSLDFASRRAWPTKGRRADILATALAILLSEAGERVGLLGAERRLFQGKTAPGRFLEALIAHLTDEAAASAPDPGSAPRIAAGDRVILISDFYANLADAETAGAHFAGEGAGGALLQIVDPSEEDFPFRGRTEFEDFRSADRLTFGDAGAVRDGYRGAFAAHRERLSGLARRLGWTFVAHRTDRPATTALMALYAALAGRGAMAR